MSFADNSSARLATRLSFLASGFGKACWAPIVPFAKSRLGVDDGTFGLMLLCLGFGSVLTMPLAGVMSGRTGTRPIIVGAGITIALLLPLLSVASSPATFTVALFCFGAALGAIDVAMNVHAVAVEKAMSRPLMSNFHAQFSIGGFTGAALMTALLSLGASPLSAASVATGSILLAVLYAGPRFLRSVPTAGDGARVAIPHGIVLVLAVLTAICFLLEGALLDWSALLVVGMGITAAAQSGFGYMIFSIAMTAGRLTGDGLTTRFGDKRMLQCGGILAVAGLALLLGIPSMATAAVGFLMIGLGASNVVPAFFRMAAAQRAMPSGLAISAVTTTGYAGILVGPAVIGLVSQRVGLTTAFWLLAALVSLIPLFAAKLTSGAGVAGKPSGKTA